MTHLTPADALVSPERQRLSEQARAYVDASKAPNTLRAYRADWADFHTWCAAHGEQPLPAAPDAVARYLADHAETLKASTLQRRLTSIAVAHRYAGLPSPADAPLVQETLKGIRRTKARAGETVARKEAAVTAIIRRMVTALPDTLAGARDRAILLLGFAGALRRSELVALDLDDLRFTHEGLVITLRRSKTDQEGQGEEKGIPYGSNPDTCPVRAVRRWLELAAIAPGPIFAPIDRHGRIRPARLCPQGVAIIIKRAAERAGLDPAQFAGHSLRAGLATAAAEAGVSERSIMSQTGHRSVAVARRYIRRGSLFRDNAAAQVGL
jgi:site-specific recombinase XerD